MSMRFNISGIGDIKEDLWFTSDTLFFDIIDEENDMFDSIEDKHEYIIEKWNTSVKPRDIIYHLGNFSNGNKKQTREILKRLNGRINLVVGSEDSKNNVLGLRNMLSSCNYRLEITVNNYMLTLNHYPQRRWKKDNRSNSWMLHGYCRHKSPPQQGKLSLDVGFSGFDRPLHFDEIEDIMSKKNRFYENLRKKEPIVM